MRGRDIYDFPVIISAKQAFIGRDGPAVDFSWSDLWVAGVERVAQGCCHVVEPCWFCDSAPVASTAMGIQGDAVVSSMEKIRQ